MTPKFDVIFLEEVMVFLDELNEKDREKIIYNIDKARYSTDPKLFKKIKGEIWEFRSRYNKKQYRLFAFWDKRDDKKALVVTSHGIVKKTSKLPIKEIDKAEMIREKYFEENY